MNNTQLTLIKLGGGLITDKTTPFVARQKVIRRLGKEIREATGKLERLIIAHGSGSFGHSVAQQYNVAEGNGGGKSWRGLPLVADAAIRINRIVVKCLLEEGLPVVSFATASFVMADNKKPATALVEPIFRSLMLGFTPVLYGDIVFDRKRGWCIFSSEKILEILVNEFSKSFIGVRVFYCGNTDGVYDEKGKTIEVMSPKSFVKLRKSIKGSDAADVTGGMLHKVEKALNLVAHFGIETLIFNGGVKGQLKRALLGERVHGTRIASDEN